MKKLLLNLLMLIPVVIFGQAVQKNNIELAAGIGVGIYGTSSNDSASENNMAAAGLMHLSLHYTISNRISTGLILERNGYVTERDSSNKGVSLNTGIDIKYRLLNSDKTTIFANLTAGYSHFRYDDFTRKAFVSSNGYAFQPGLGFSHYFSKVIGIFLQSNYAIYKYNKLTDDKGNILETNSFTNKENFKIKISGLNIKFGLTFKF